MDHVSKGLRISCGLAMLVSLIGYVLPWVVITQENYPALSASLLDYIKAVFVGRILPMTVNEPLGTMRMAIIVVFVMLPACIAVFAGIWGIVGNARQIVTGIGSIANVLLGIGLIYEKKLYVDHYGTTGSKFLYGIFPSDVSHYDCSCGRHSFSLYPS